MQAVVLPTAEVAGLTQRVRGRFEITALSHEIFTPRRTIMPADIPAASSHQSGLFLIQYVAPATPAWQTILEEAGIEVIERLPERAIIIAATAAELRTLSGFPWIRYAGPYLPSYKFAPHASAEHKDFTVSIADTARWVDAIAAISARVGGFRHLSRSDHQLTAHFESDIVTATALLDEPFVLGVEATIPMQQSDERQALALTGRISTPAAAGTTYLNWLAASPRLITPNALTNSGIVVDVADTGLDQGCYMADEHPDLKGHCAYFKTTDGVYTYDYTGHGTVVATMIAGNPLQGIKYNDTAVATTGLGHKDSDSYGQFYYGMGIAPGIRVGSTRIAGKLGYLNTTVAQWTTSASNAYCNTAADVCANSTASCGATVQNVSSNEYDSTGSAAGVYTSRAKEFDISVRNADRATMKPLTVTLSAGNYGQFPLPDGGYESSTDVMGPATAKNAITVGAVESVRDSIPECTSTTDGGNNPSLRNLAEGYGILAYCSRRGTKDNRLKPDLLAPATLSLGARTQKVTSTYCAQGSLNDPAYPAPQYHGTSGTSFAAPVAAGAVALLRYHYSAKYGLIPSPAMYKAMLVAGARSITGGLDRLQTHLQGVTKTVTGWPSVQQGFGVITLNELLTTTTIQKAWHDQGTVLVMGQTFQRTVTVADATKPVRIVIAYTDKDAAVGDPTNPSVPTIVNDLMLTAEFTAFPYRLSGNYTDANGWSRNHSLCTPTQPSGCVAVNDVRNNVEVLNINASRFVDTSNRTFTLKVTAKSLNGVGVPGQSGGANNQDFALFALNATIQ